MSQWVLLVDTVRDLPNADTPHKVITTRDYLARPQLFEEVRPNIVNLARSVGYQTRGYYCSLLAEARGHRVIPTVEALLELSGPALYAHAVPELEEALNQAAEKLPGVTTEPFELLVCFGRVAEAGFERFARAVFDWFRAPLIEIKVTPGERLKIGRISLRAVNKLGAQHRAFFLSALAAHTRRQWRNARVRRVPDWSLALLHDPDETLAPSTPDTLRYFARIAAKMGVEVEPVTKRDLPRLAEFDALLIRETTSIDNHTYRFARRAVQEGMPVIDDPISMIRCTNKVYLSETLAKAGAPQPKTVILSEGDNLGKAVETLGLPIVIKAPDSSFSRGVHKAETMESLEALAKRLFVDTDLLLAQEFLPTAFDWRIGVLDGKPIFSSRYKMARGHWQIVRHREGAAPVQGGAESISLADTPAPVIDAALLACKPIGSGLYGVDVKETDRGVFVIEVNDNPDIHHGWEDQIEKDAIWRALVRWFVARLEA